MLFLGGGKDARARWLGLVFLSFGTLFTDRLLGAAIPALPAAASVPLLFVARTHLIAFQPLLSWQFAWHFPRVQSALVPPWLPPLMVRVTAAAGAVLLVANLVAHGLASPVSTAVGARVTPEGETGFFWQTVTVLLLPSLALLVAKLRVAHRTARRRLAWVVAGFVIGTLAMVLHVLLAWLIPRYAAFASEPGHGRIIGMSLTAFSLVIPATTAYAVVVEHVLDVRFVIRRAVQYALARYTVLALMAAPVIGLISVGLGNYTKPIGDILRDSPVFTAAFLVAAGMLAWRRALLESIDRRFFREHYDARRILVELVDKSRKAQTTRNVITLITSEVDRALHLERISMLVRHYDSLELRDPDDRIRALDAAGPLAALIAGSHAPLTVDLSSDSSPLARLPDADRQWLADASARLVVPLLGAQDSMIGVIALGEKRSELPFTQEDRDLMMAVAASAALALEQKLQSESPRPDGLRTPPVHGARQCVACGRVQETGPSGCDTCGSAVREALLPAVLAGKFELERQIGAGGMGVVYRARDLTLDRRVALKVLPRVDAHAVTRLRREARAMAMMQHPNLAVIHAMESWGGAPVLVLEYLPGGTLADRIRHGVIPVAETITLGEVLGDVLHHVHRAGFLHRDIKPSNIGFTDEGTAKLLDFGLVRMMNRLSDLSTVTDGTVLAPGATGQRRITSLLTAETAVQHIVGTPAYMSPEALATGSVDQGLDLWGLALTLYEALTGTNPFIAPTIDQTVTRVLQAEVPDARHTRPDCPPALAEFLAGALALERSRRPQSALEFSSSLRAIV